MPKHYFYVLFCADETLYAGYTVNLNRREQEHNMGAGAKYTSLAKRRPVKIIYSEEYATRSAAMQREAAFKQLSRLEKIMFLQDHNINLPFVILSDMVKS
ncbi:GIY-YIG nuclease family protein [Spiroplasma citri]|uniref:GIY-YIG nuclease family protein n=1 Tax=Spiroplasma citri TaxID=2133 RepID=Q14PT1_SPICI|nr:GIY-YIG nuclease family protein [Spiroplasma citri]APE74154.1 putative endonuclease [Spiroplasma citri]QED24131.1 GIY-YIG nuclease family protein [Spiroplasma citri]QIA66409.1 GIY-YIG nuclease family protein [Spiroplasma citri]QIA68286.1 GIY-YIG nuclease family protein [Spiroplasma citri]QIA70161.1 GIY-YIG nuclease family protein [Spiroplasma citri]